MLVVLLPAAIRDCMGAAVGGKCMEYCSHELASQTASCMTTMHGAGVQRLMPGTAQGARQLTDGIGMAGSISIHPWQHISSHGITAPGRLQEGDEGWGRRAMDGYRRVLKSEQ